MTDLLTPARPPQSVAGNLNPFESWNETPLFMQTLPQEQGGLITDKDKIKENNTLDALQALMYEGHPSEIAAGFKDQANVFYAARKFRDAIKFYTQALDECGRDLPIEERRILWSNRAAANLELGNFGTTLKDTSLVLSAPLASYPEPPSAAYNKTTLKALLRSARALNGLEKLPEAIDVLSRLKVLEIELGQEKDDVGKKVREEVEGKVWKKERRAAEIVEKTRRAKEGEKRMREALASRGVSVPRTTLKNPLFSSCPIDITPPHFDPSSLPSNSLPSLPLLPPLIPTSPPTPFISWQPPPITTPLIFPIFLLLPLTDPPTRDLYLTFSTNSTFGEILLAMNQIPTSLNLYISTMKGKVLKVGNKLTLGKVLEAAGREEGDSWELMEGWALEMTGVPKTIEGEKWVEVWKKEVQEGVRTLL